MLQIAILLFTSISMAQPNCGFTPQDSFIEISEIGRSLAATEASVLLQILEKDSLWQKCSGAVVSDAGHIMTAGHCLENCRTEKEEPSVLANPYRNVMGSLRDYKRTFDNKKNRPTQCLVKINGTESLVDVLLTSECSFAEHEYAENQGPCLKFNEVAVILPKQKSVDAKCLPISPGYKVGDYVYTVGNPAASGRKSTDHKRLRGDSDGERTFASFGQVIESRRDCTLIGTPLQNSKKLLGTKIKMERLRPHIMASAIQTTVDVLPGSSGGPLVNEKNELIAVASFGDSDVNHEWAQCEGSTFFSPIAGVGEDTNRFAQNFKMSDLVCDKNRVR